MDHRLNMIITYLTKTENEIERFKEFVKIRNNIHKVLSESKVKRYIIADNDMVDKRLEHKGRIQESIENVKAHMYDLTMTMNNMAKFILDSELMTNHCHPDKCSKYNNECIKCIKEFFKEEI